MVFETVENAKALGFQQKQYLELFVREHTTLADKIQEVFLKHDRAKWSNGAKILNDSSFDVGKFIIRAKEVKDAERAAKKARDDENTRQRILAQERKPRTYTVTDPEIVPESSKSMYPRARTESSSSSSTTAAVVAKEEVFKLSSLKNISPTSRFLSTVINVSDDEESQDLSIDYKKLYVSSEKSVKELLVEREELFARIESLMKDNSWLSNEMRFFKNLCTSLYQELGETVTNISAALNMTRKRPRV